MTSSSSAKCRACSLEMLVGVVERVMAQERQLQNAVKQIASINSTLVGFKTDMKATSAADGSELAGNLVRMIHGLRRELYVEMDELKKELSMRNAASVPAADKEDFSKPGRMETLGTHEGKDAISEERVELSEHLIDVDAEQTKANVSGVPEQLQEQQDLHSELHQLSDQVRALREQVSKIDMDQHLGQTQLQKIDKVEEIWENLTMDKLDKNSVGYEIQESIWDSCAFFGFECISAGSTLWIFMGVVATIVMELLLVLVVFANYSANPYTDEMLEGLLHWRAVVAHDIRNSDPASGASLAALTCAQASGIATSTLQMNEATQILDFREPDAGALRSLNGLVLCNLALFLWLATVFEDMVTNYRFSLSVLSHPRGRSSIKEFGEQIRIASFSVPQVFLIFLLSVLPRLTINIFLGIAGIFFLGYTPSVNDLLLNSVALTFILDVDELFFTVFIPLPVKLLMRTVEPLSYHSADPGTGTCPAVNRCFHEYITQVLRLSAIGIVLYFCNTLLVMPFNEKLDKAYEYICGGKQDLLYHKSDTANWVRHANSPSASTDLQQVYEMNFQKMSVLELVDLDPKYYSLPENVFNSSPKLDYEALLSFHAGGREYEMSNMFCVDYTNITQLNYMYPSTEFTGKYAQSARLIIGMDALGVQEEVLCSQVGFSSCTQYTFSKARALCPRTCGCDNPWSGQFYATGNGGCPFACDIRWQMNAYILPPRSIANFTDKCADVPADILSLDFGWNSYLTGLLSYLNSFGNSSYLVEPMRQGGCASAFDLTVYVDICKPNPDFRSVRLWCPAACGCSMSDMRECPRSCSAFETYQILQMSHMDRCPWPLELKSAAECERAADVLFGLVVPARIAAGHTKPGCFLQQTEGLPKLLWSNESANTSASQRITLCRQAEPLIWDIAAGGRFTLQQNWTKSFIADEPLQAAPPIFQD